TATGHLQYAFTSLLADLLRARLSLVNGMPAIIAAAFPPLTADHAVSVSTDPGWFAQTASPTARRVAQSVEISAHPLWAASPLHATLFEFYVDLWNDGSPVQRLVDSSF